MRWLTLLLAAACLVAGTALADPDVVILASTTSTQNSGLYDAILPKFTEETGIEVRVIAVGTGQALRLARNGDADILIVHHRPSEDQFIAEGYGVDRRDVMFNDFIIAGPRDDPAGVRTAANAAEALRRIATAQARFASRGDESGTHLKEAELWAAADVAPAGKWYQETGSGMGATLNFAAAVNAYLLVDRGTWLTFGNKQSLGMLFWGDPVLFNPYGVILVNPERFPHVNASGARALADWLTSAEGQAAIGAFRIGGAQPFCPDATGHAAEAPTSQVCPAVRH